MRPKAVLFDCDGVLVDSEPATRALVMRRLGEAGLDLDGADFAGMFLGGTMAGLAARAREMGARIHEAWVDETYEELFAVLDREVRPIPGAPELVAALAGAGIDMAICSNGPMRKMDITLARTGLLPWFDGRVFSGHVHGRPKPEPDLYLHGARHLGHGPADCVVIEDSPTGARAARAAGIRCFGLAADSDAGKLAAEGATVIMALDELPRLLGL